MTDLLEPFQCHLSVLMSHCRFSVKRLRFKEVDTLPLFFSGNSTPTTRVIYSCTYSFTKYFQLYKVLNNSTREAGHFNSKNTRKGNQ